MIRKQRARPKLITDRELWPHLAALTRGKKTISAAIAYVSKMDVQLLQFKSGDMLVANISRQAVKQGATNPHVLLKLFRKKVRIHNCENLHAKIVVAGDKVICGSANASSNSLNALSEAAVVVADASVASAAKAYINLKCGGGPVGRAFLKQRANIYRPPLKLGIEPHGSDSQMESLWIIPLTQNDNAPKDVDDKAEKDSKSVRTRYAVAEANLDYFHWPSPIPAYLNLIKAGDWIIQALQHRYTRAYYALAPMKFLERRTHKIPGTSRSRAIFYCEATEPDREIGWITLCRRAKSIVGNLANRKHRCITDPEAISYLAKTPTRKPVESEKGFGD